LSLVVWRIVNGLYSKEMFGGEGSYRYGGRWNSKGIRVVYTSQNLSLAALELLVHLKPTEVDNYFVSACAEIPEDIEIEAIESSSIQYSPNKLKEIGDRWVNSQTSAVLSVSSAVIPEEKNYLLNPNHPDFQRVIFNQPQEFTLDPRLVKQKPSWITQLIGKLKASLSV
jgi:RES domain-containing protein